MNKRVFQQQVLSQPVGKYKQSGFSLIEALVAFLILSIGMLGIASLQTMSLKAGHTATLRMAAVMKADEILESMRANSTADPVVLLSYAAGTGDSGSDNGCSQTTVAAVVCSPIQLAADDIFRWTRSLTEALPNNASTTASVVVTPPVPPETMTDIVVTINWSERDVDNGGATNMNYSVTTQM
jgi:type IV pilus assembly protein PilV